MKKIGKPVRKMPEKVDQIIKIMFKDKNTSAIDFDNTEIAFEYKSDDELKKTGWLYSMMNKHWVVTVGAKLGIAAIQMRLPFIKKAIKYTIYEQFCGGTTLLESQDVIEKMYDFNVHTVLDYGAEGKDTEEEFNGTMNETIRALEFAGKNEAVLVVSSKITGFARFDLLKKMQEHATLTEEEELEFKSVMKRIDAICSAASKNGVSIYFDAEETWIQEPIDNMVNKMMERYNKERLVVFNTFQLYAVDRLQYLIDSYNMAQKDGYLLGAKLVRGAYMDKERARAAEMDYTNPIHPNKEATDNAYNTAVRFCVDNIEHIGLCNATHNRQSTALQVELMAEKGIPNNHPHMVFSQLFGMSDNLTYNLSKKGYNATKYLPYGPVYEVVPYLIRRAEENSSVTGDMSREYQFIRSELERRGLT